MRPPLRLADTYRFPDFRPSATVRGVCSDPKARILQLVRRGKNTLRRLRHGGAGVLQPQGTSGARPLLWRYAGLPGDQGPARTQERVRPPARERPLIHQGAKIYAAVAAGTSDPRGPPRPQNVAPCQQAVADRLPAQRVL